MVEQTPLESGDKEFKNFEEFKSSTEEITLGLSKQTDEVILKSPLKESKIFTETNPNNDGFIKEWFESFYEDLREAKKQDFDGLWKINYAKERMQNVIENKLLELETRYAQNSKLPDSTNIDQNTEKELTKEFKQKIYSSLALASALGVDPEAKEIKEMKKICSQEKILESDLNEILKFRANVLALMPSRILLEELSTLSQENSKSEHPDKNISTLTEIYTHRLKRDINEFLNTGNIVKDVSKLEKSILDFQQYTAELLQRPELDNAYYGTLKEVANFTATVLIPYYSTAKMFYRMSAEGQNFTKTEIMQTILLDTVCLLPTTKLLGGALKGGGKALGLGRVATTGTALEQMVTSSRGLYEASNIGGTVISSCFMLVESYKKTVDEEKKATFREIIINALMLGGYISVSGGTTYVLNGSFSDKVKEICKVIEVAVTDPIEGKVKNNNTER